jgi:feruloyl-CoA synthase
MSEPAPPFRPLPQKPADASLEARPDGSFIVRSNYRPAQVPGTMGQIFRERSAEIPEREFILEREPGHGPWRAMTYGESRKAADSIGQWLLDRGLVAGDTVMVISGNSVEHAMLMLGCYTAGIAIAPVSPAYSLMSQDHAKLLHCASVLQPRVVFAREGDRHAAAIARLREADPDLIVVTSDGGADDAVDFARLLMTSPGAELESAFAAVGTDAVAKFLFTSGSTGMPKCVPQTHRMMTAVIAGTEALADRPRAERVVPRSLEWMPWSHISGGNIFFNGTIWAGGTMHLDEGRPMPGLFETTIRNLYEISPTGFGSAPIAFAMLADAMERDTRLRTAFFANLQSMGYGGATLSDDLYDRLQALAVAETGQRIPITTMYGATETQGVTMVHWEVDRVGLIGLPMPGVELKLAPSGSKLEVRVKGDSVTRGYKGAEDGAQSPFDEEGFYRLGDAARIIDPADINQGLVFDGRVAEDFKLSSGTWVSVGTLRPEIVAACSPLVHDVVVAGHDKPYIAALVFPSPAAVQSYAAEHGDDALAALERDIAGRIATFNRDAGGSSRVVRRVAILTEPPSLDAGEVTDKGYINQRTVLERRASFVRELFDEQRAVR